MDSNTKNVQEHKFQWMGIKVHFRWNVRVNELEERSTYISHAEKQRRGRKIKIKMNRRQ